MAASSPPTNYPRPDFVRPNLNWKLLDDQEWQMLYDDQDLGLSAGWHLQGVPDQVEVADASAAGQSEAELQKLAAFPELKEVGFARPNATHNKKKPIKLPYVFQTPASGWGDNEAHEVLWYETVLNEPRAWNDVEKGLRVLVRFGAVDYETSIWVAGRYVGGHRGGHVPFDVDVTDALTAAANEGKEAKLVMRVRDSPSDLEQPRGKQYWAPTPESIFYTPSSGIWQSVWMEVVPAARIAGSSEGTVLQSTDIEGGVLKAKVNVVGRRAGAKYDVEIESSIGGVSVGKTRQATLKDKDYVKLDVNMKVPAEQLKQLSAELTGAAPTDNADCWKDGVALWSVDHPTLYDVTIRLYDSTGELLDEVDTYTGMRSINWTTGDGTFRLNGKPIFQTLTLDQGYWPETGITPPSSESLKLDIELTKKMGFNGCRKHQKVEDPRFLYWADKLGFLVWGEIANAYEFSEEYMKRFDAEWTEAVRRDINHPSIIVWTPVNESWAYPSLKDNVEQRNHIRSLYYMTKSLDPTRPINDNCGWEHVNSDLSTFHDYNDAPALEKSYATLESTMGTKLAGRGMFVGPAGADAGSQHKQGAPVICSEFGGVNIKPKSDEDKATDRDWGYTTASDPQDLLKRIEAIVMAVIKPGHISGVVWTQITDIEQEVNGLYSYDRKEKIDPAEVKKIMDRAAKMYLDGVTK
ncbi:hypothetical protein PG996_000988 [Apiospora saccharicola]|uniref:Glycoside hydrolase family 2 protein n=1 Tax=Apiospora saccharicola TaxID=335842 RepID=A0ABR1WGU4_9PEZI